MFIDIMYKMPRGQVGGPSKENSADLSGEKH